VVHLSVHMTLFFSASKQVQLYLQPSNHLELRVRTLPWKKHTPLTRGYGGFWKTYVFLLPISSASVISRVEVGPAAGLVGPAGPLVAPEFVGPAVPAGEPVPDVPGTLFGVLPDEGGATTGPVIEPGTGATCPAGLTGKSHMLQNFLQFCLAKPL